MGERLSKVTASALAIALGLTGVGGISFSDRSIALQQQPSELDREMAEGTALFRQGSKESLNAAIAHFEKAEKLSRASGDKANQALAQLTIGRIYINLGEQQKALDFCNQALLLYRSMGNSPENRQGAAAALLNIGGVYSSLGDKKKAIEYYSQSLLISREVKSQSLEATLLNNIGRVYASLGRNKEAIDYYNQSLPLLRAERSQSYEASTMLNIGFSYSMLGDNKKEIDYFKQGLQIFRAIGDKRGEASALNNIGVFYRNSGEEEKAIDYYKQSIPLLRAMGNRSGEAITLSNISSILINQKQPELSIVLLKQSITIFESLRQDVKELPRETREIYTSSISYYYRNLAHLFLVQGRIHEAQSILELLKVQEVSSYGNVINPAQRLFPFNPIEIIALASFEKMIASRQTLSLADLALIDNILIEHRDRIIQDSNNSPSPIGNPQAILNANPNALLIQNLVAGNNLWVLWTDASRKTTATFVPNFTQEQLKTTVQKFRDQLGSSSSNLDELKATSKQLYNWLIPIELQSELKKHPKQQLIFSLDHVTRYIPVAALYDGSQYLAQRYILSNLVTMDSDMSDRLSLNGKTPNVLALGTSKAFPPNFNALPNVPAELSAIVRDDNDKGIYPGKIHLNEAFTANSLRDNREPFRILHIATHGSFNHDSITESFLLLGDGTHLPITDIASLTNLNTIHLVVLSACETGLSNTGQDGTEISGISGYFLYRGAKAVLASLWQVNDASTSLLMQQFYQNLATGKLTKAEALQLAQRSMITDETQVSGTEKPRSSVNYPIGAGQNAPIARNLSHPYYWAPFILIGNGL